MGTVEVGGSVGMGFVIRREAFYVREVQTGHLRRGLATVEVLSKTIQ